MTFAINDQLARYIRDTAPPGPPWPPYCKQLAKSLEVYGPSVINILTGSTFNRPSACPKWHPLWAVHAERREIRKQVTPKDRKSLGDQQGWVCIYCCQDISGDGDANLNFKTPISKGGTAEYSNLQLVCRSCNASKSDSTDEEFRERLKWNHQIHQMREEQEWCCIYCAASILSNFSYSYKLPLERGGVREISNVNLACRDCSALKKSWSYTDQEFSVARLWDRRRRWFCAICSEKCTGEGPIFRSLLNDPKTIIMLCENCYFGSEVPVLRWWRHPQSVHNRISLTISISDDDTLSLIVEDDDLDFDEENEDIAC